MLSLLEGMGNPHSPNKSNWLATNPWPANHPDRHKDILKRYSLCLSDYWNKVPQGFSFPQGSHAVQFERHLPTYILSLASTLSDSTILQKKRWRFSEIERNMFSWLSWCTSIITVLGKLKQEDCFKFEDSLGYDNRQTFGGTFVTLREIWKGQQWCTHNQGNPGASFIPAFDHISFFLFLRQDLPT